MTTNTTHPDQPAQTTRPAPLKKYRCHNCMKIVSSKPCPECGEEHHVEPTCTSDHQCHCIDDISSGAHFCPVCGEPVCPCGSHDVLLISRVTGYLQDYSGFNRGKQQEVRDRTRYDIATRVT